MIHFENELVTVHYYPDANTGIGQWHGTAKDDTYKESMMGIAKLIKDKGIKTWIGHMVGLKFITPALQEWTNTTWFPAALGGGLKNIAVVVSEEALGKMSVNQIMTKTNDFTTKYFDDLDSAKAWVKSLS